MSGQADRAHMEGLLRLCFDLLDVRLDVLVRQRSLEVPVRAAVDYFALRPAGRSSKTRGITFSFDGAAVALPEGASKEARFAPGMDLLRYRRSFYLRYGDSAAKVDPGRCTVAVHVSENDRADAAGLAKAAAFFIWGGLSILLGRFGLFVLHAAAVSHDGKGYLVLGPSGSGKSTVALGLVRQGWSYLSDDFVVLRDGPDSVEVGALRKDFCLDAESSTVFPEIAAFRRPSITNDEKWRIDVRALHPDLHVATGTPRVLLLPTVRNQPKSVVRVLRRQEALLELLRESGLFLALIPTITRAHMSLLKKLVQQCTCYRVDLGRDHGSDPDMISTLIAQNAEELPLCA